MLSGVRSVASLVSFVSVLLLTGCYNTASEYEALIRNAKIIEAHISSKNCRNHGAVVYKFTLEGKNHYGYVPWGLVSCESVHVGDLLEVYYDPQRPEVHTPLNPAEAYRREKGYYFPLWALFVLGVHLILLINFMSNQKQMKHKR